MAPLSLVSSASGPTYSRSLAGLAVIVATLLAAQASSAQGLSGAKRDSTETAAITGFASLPWGATADEVVARWGRPDTTHALEELSATALVYPNEEVLGEAAAMGILIHERRGLIRGQYLVHYGGGRDCERIYRKYRNAVSEALSGLTRQERKTTTAADSTMGFCTAFELGNAGAWSRWRDSVTGAQATVRLDGGQSVLRVSYEGPGYEELTERARARERDARFGGVGDVTDGRSDSAAVDSLIQLLRDSTRIDSTRRDGG